MVTVAPAGIVSPVLTHAFTATLTLKLAPPALVKHPEGPQHFWDPVQHPYAAPVPAQNVPVVHLSTQFPLALSHRCDKGQHVPAQQERGKGHVKVQDPPTHALQ